jgi:hypothetical protein
MWIIIFKRNIMNKTIQFILLLFLGVLFLAGFIIIMEWGMERQEQYECQKWQIEAIEFADKGWSAADWQYQQCSHWGLNLPGR